MGSGKMKRDSKKDELRLSFWDDTLITDMDCIYGWIAFSGEWGKCHFSIIQTFILLYMPEIWKPFLLFFVFVLPYRCAVDCRWFLLLLRFKFNGRQRLHFSLRLLSLSSERQISSTAKPLSPFLASVSLPIFIPSPWLVTWRLPFFWFSRHMLPRLISSRQDLALHWTLWTLILD